VNRYSIEKNKFVRDGEILITIKDDIKDYVIVNDCIIILADSSKSKNDQNIYCYDVGGELIWQIPPVDKLHFDNYYTSVYLSEQGSLQAYNKNGIEITINKQDGNILQKELIK
jgi:hypothetical protein